MTSSGKSPFDFKSPVLLYDRANADHIEIAFNPYELEQLRSKKYKRVKPERVGKFLHSLHKKQVPERTDAEFLDWLFAQTQGQIRLTPTAYRCLREGKETPSLTVHLLHALSSTFGCPVRALVAKRYIKQVKTIPVKVKGSIVRDAIYSVTTRATTGDTDTTTTQLCAASDADMAVDIVTRHLKHRYGDGVNLEFIGCKPLRPDRRVFFSCVRSIDEAS